ncbi:MAG: CBS domain-containing protein [Candidatus Aenigmarchaeota archaeon]|nr:CBS domain-containing protein [Candidatus Aenigmarchaeota archaeon]
MLPEAFRIKDIRKSRGMTQQELAKSSGVSQSFIARVERGDVDPSYSKMIKILSALKNKKMPKAKNIMIRRVVMIGAKESIKKAAGKMKAKGISQLPVMKNGAMVGAISEKDIAYAITENPGAKTVEEIMSIPLPIVDDNSDIEMLSSILEHVPALLVSRNGKIAGIVTRADLLGLA